MTVPLKPHPADAGANGECSHGNPLWGFCSRCLRYDAYPDQPDSWGKAHLPAARADNPATMAALDRTAFLES